MFIDIHTHDRVKSIHKVEIITPHPTYKDRTQVFLLHTYQIGLRLVACFVGLIQLSPFSAWSLVLFLPLLQSEQGLPWPGWHDCAPGISGLELSQWRPGLYDPYAVHQLHLEMHLWTRGVLHTFCKEWTDLLLLLLLLKRMVGIVTSCELNRGVLGPASDDSDHEKEAAKYTLNVHSQQLLSSCSSTSIYHCHLFLRTMLEEQLHKLRIAL
jgi:hypothetical protein